MTSRGARRRRSRNEVPETGRKDEATLRPPVPRSFRASVAAVTLMILGLLALYCPPQLFEGKETLLGSDFQDIHERRIRYAQEALLGPEMRLPAWYTRELMGTPFWSNIQSFPFLPTRLTLFWLDPETLYPAAVNLAAILAALFTYLYCRKLGVGRIGSAVAGWTFSASGFFASRVMAGHLPLIEAFGALPLLLWILECIAQAGPGGRRLQLANLGLALAAFSVVLAGHPQVPIYAMGTAALYALVRMWGRKALVSLWVMALGAGLSGFVWWPMFRLIARSTRVLALDRADNDLSIPYWRLKAFFLPWADGWPEVIRRSPSTKFVGPMLEIFWDTVCYVGWVPLLAVLVLLVGWLRKGKLPARPWLFLAAVGVGALLMALPFAQVLANSPRATFLRSPSRLLYLTTFALAAATGVLIDRVLRTGPKGRRWSAVGLAALLAAVHAVDLSFHDRHFVQIVPRAPLASEEIQRWRNTVADQRIAMDSGIRAPWNRQVDDVGFFDSIMLARPYRAVIALMGEPEQLNVQNVDGSVLSVPALSGLSAAGVFTNLKRDDMKLMIDKAGRPGYLVPDPAHRAIFLPDTAVGFLEEREMLDRFRAGTFDLRGRMNLPPSARPEDLQLEARGVSSESSVRYDRPDSDHIVVQVSSGTSGFLRIMESWDEGWSATVDGMPSNILVADTFAMAVRLLPGDHQVSLTYRTPGVRVGAAITALSAVLLAVLLFRSRPLAPIELHT